MPVSRWHPKLVNMEQPTKIKVASAITALFLGGLAALGLATRPASQETAAVAPVEPKVVHKRTVKTVKVPSASSSSGSGAPATTPVASTAASVPVSAPAPVASQTSPGAGGGGGYGDDGENEYEGGGEESD